MMIKDTFDIYIKELYRNFAWLEIQTLKIEYIMALEIRSIPVLTGETAERFVREAEENERNPKRRKLLFSFEDIDNMMERSRKYLKEHGGKGPFAK